MSSSRPICSDNSSLCTVIPCVKFGSILNLEAFIVSIILLIAVVLAVIWSVKSRFCACKAAIFLFASSKSVLHCASCCCNGTIDAFKSAISFCNGAIDAFKSAICLFKPGIITLFKLSSACCLC